jgi:hypothetical protein
MTNQFYYHYFSMGRRGSATFSELHAALISRCRFSCEITAISELAHMVSNQPAGGRASISVLIFSASPLVGSFSAFTPAFCKSLAVHSANRQSSESLVLNRKHWRGRDKATDST